jgi:cyclic beta-1,2-glucan synthetase
MTSAICRSGQLVERTANTLRTLHGCSRHRGHFYNWYDTQTLQPLSPLYISTVDSGNLAGHLLTLRAGLLALGDDRMLGARLFDGLADTYRILVHEAGQAAAVDGVAARTLAAFGKQLEAVAASPPETLAALQSCLERLASSAVELAGEFVPGLDGVGDNCARERRGKAAGGVGRGAGPAMPHGAR